MNSSTNISIECIVDPRFIISYASYYIYGFYNLLGKNRVKFQCIPDLKINNHEDYRNGCAYVVTNKQTNKRTKIFIDTNDSSLINKSFYNWCDIYAKINVDKDTISLHNKIICIGPSFGIQLWNPLKTIYKSIIHYFKIMNNRTKSYYPPFKTYIKDYCYMFIRRSKFIEYKKNYHENPDYCFSINTLWYDKFTDNNTNYLRGIFMKKAKQIYPKFDGGFFYIGDKINSEFPGYHKYKEMYSDLIYTKRISSTKYIKQTQKSAIVFNTPSVSNCHGWKLAEYLCMGKCIISTPLSHMMPGNFNAGVQYLECLNENEIIETITYLKQHPQKILQLKQQSKQYFEEYLSPEIVCRRIITHNNEPNY